VDEFRSIADLFRPLTNGAPEAFGLLDDAAAIPSRPGFDLVITQDAMVQGVHFLRDDPPGLVAQKLLRVNLSDLAAKAAEPYAYFLAVAWPKGWGEAGRAAFAAGLAQDQARYGLVLLGGDTVSTPGPLTLSVTMLGWTPTGAMVRRAGAEVGHVLLASGTIGDGALGLRAAQGEDLGLSAAATAALAERYRLPQPRNTLCTVLRRYAAAAADVSDGLIADAGHIAAASGVGLRIDLDRLPLSLGARQWLDQAADRAAALTALATGGDDYEVVCTIKAADADAAIALAAESGVVLTAIGASTRGSVVEAFIDGRPTPIARRGWTHG
jgi:thiamine-monophosphate kinase